MYFDSISHLCGHAVCFVFFFQAEDGIRDLVRSRGLGDVYKRQLPYCIPYPPLFKPYQKNISAVREIRSVAEHMRKPVSYTHLTLPTSDLV